MKLNMSEFEKYLNSNVFSNGIRLVKEMIGNPSVSVRFNKAEFLYERRTVNLYGDSCVIVEIKHFDNVDIIDHADAPTSIVIHTAKSTIYDSVDIVLWHLKQRD